MKKLIIALGLFLTGLSGFFGQECFAATPASLSGAVNADYACTPPFISQAAKPNIHFVLDKTGSMTEHPYNNADGTYDPAHGYWGYFKEDKYYKYDLSLADASRKWEENAACTNTDLIGHDNCISGKLLNFVTMSKLDIMRKILTGGRTWASDTGTPKSILEHETTTCPSGCTSANLDNEATTGCDFNHDTAGKVVISSSNSAARVKILASSSSNQTKVVIVGSGATATATFTWVTGSKFVVKYADGTSMVAGDQFITSGFANAGNNGIWTIMTISTTAIKVLKGTAVTEAARTKVLIEATSAPTGLSCTLFTAKSADVPMTVDSATKTFTRTGGGSFVTDNWDVGMEFTSAGFLDAGNNNTWTISNVTANTITVTSNSGMVTRAIADLHIRFTRTMTAWIRVKTTTPADITGLIQSLYVAPGSDDNKADLILSFYAGGNVNYAGGDTTNNTTKNQLLANYINAVNGTGGSGGTSTGPAMAITEKYYKQEAITSGLTTGGGNALIDIGNGASDPFYSLDSSGTASLAAPCRKSFIILVSDGEWNSGSDPVGPTFNMHRRDKDASNVQHDLRTQAAMQPGIQSVTTYVVYAFGASATGRNALITTAIFGGFDDTDNNRLPYPFTSYPTAPPYASSAKLKTTLNTTGYTDGRVVAGTTKRFLDDPAEDLTFPMDECNPDGTWNDYCGEWDRSPGATTDNPTQKHTGLPYNYFEATDGAVLAQAMINAVNDILGRTSSSTAASILGNNDNAGASLVQAMFYPEKQFEGTIKASWIGEVQSFWYYIDPRLNNVTIREDSDTDLKLKLSTDKVAQFDFDGTYTKVFLYADADGDGAIDNYTDPPTNPDTTVDVENVKNLWRGGKSLWSRAASDRVIYTNDPTVAANSGARMAFTSTAANATKLQPYLDVSTASGAVPTAAEVIDYARGTDISSSYTVRSRQVQLDGATNTWKLGDIVNSTPKISSEVRLNSYNLTSPSGYSDSSYDKYIKSKDYNDRGVAYVGANDGMLHAFKTGSNFIGSSSGYVAEIKNADKSPATDLGKETWAFIPKHALPYLQYLMLPSYQHIYSIDGTPTMVDASISLTNTMNKDGSGITAACDSSAAFPYTSCPLRTTVSSNHLDYSTAAAGGGTSWRTVLIGSMGLGGASRNKGTVCTNCVKTPVTNLGYSSFFALDVTTPLGETETDYPKLLWEFGDPRLGFSTVSPAIMRIKDPNDTADNHRNGRWVAVLASGPTGPITAATLSFEGRSDRPLTVFVVDLKTGALVHTFNNLPCSDAVNSFDTNCASIHTQVAAMPSNAFAGALQGATIDVDKYNSSLPGAYSDDALYIGYTRNTTTTPTAWDKGGVLRLLTYNDYSPANWKISTVIDGIGPVTSAVTKLQDKTKHNLWLYFGTGRYFTKGDDPVNVQSIFGIKDPCFGSTDTYTGSVAAPCTTTLTASSDAAGASGTGLINQTSSIGAVGATDKGWFINLPGASGGNFPKRVITDPVASINGILTFTTFTPSTDICSYGGKTSVWSIKYDTGGATTGGQKGQILIQLSTGAFQQVNAETAFTESLNRETLQYDGVPPKNQPAVTTNSNHVPSKRILHIQER